MMGYVWFGIIFVAMVVAAIQGTMGDVTMSALDPARTSVALAIKLVGVMALFLGVMKVAQDAGLLRVISRAIRPIMVRLFPDVPAEHPAMGAMIMNMSANMLGLANAATPFGIKAMMELDKLNRHKGTATNAMVLFLAINTSNVTILPTGTIGIRHAAGSADAAGIIPSTLFATICSTIVAIIAVKLLQRLPIFRIRAEESRTDGEERDTDIGEDLEAKAADALEMDEGARRFWRVASPLVMVGGLAGIVAMVLFADQVKDWVIPMIIFGLLAYGLAIQLLDRRAGREPRLEIYGSFIEGAKDGFNVALKIIPYLVAILVAVGMFRASGALDLLKGTIGPLTEPLGLPAEALPMALLRPLSGSGAFGYMAEMVNTAGPDTYLGYLVSTMQGSTETTFYVIAVYFGAVQVSRLRHAIPAALTADFAGVIAAVVICVFLFGSTRDAEGAREQTAEVVFAPDSAYLSRRVRKEIDEALAPLVAQHLGDDTACFAVAGVGNDEILAARRASTVLQYLVLDWEYPADRFTTGTGPPTPCEDDDEACQPGTDAVRLSTHPCDGG